jgi:Ca-activated chloride channel homolog
MGNAQHGTRKGVRGRHILIPVLLCGGMVLVSPAKGAEDPDTLYRQGRFAEAKEIYAQADMDAPKDLRYRYNRGCAAYQAGDFQGASAAFASVLRRAEDRELRYRAAYNLGNAALKSGDPNQAAASYREALRIHPDQQDAQYNLELALREIEAQKRASEEEASQGEKGGQGDQRQRDKEGRGQSSPGDSPEEDQTGKKDQAEKGREDGSTEMAPGHEDEGAGRDREQAPGQAPSPDLSGELSPREALSEPSEGEDAGAPAESSMDREKAEALLNNVTEDRSKFLRLQMPKEGGRRHMSGKDW